MKKQTLMMPILLTVTGIVNVQKWQLNSKLNAMYKMSLIISALIFSSTWLIAQSPWYTNGNALSANGILGSNTNYSILFRTNGVNHGTLTNAGNWGIGTIAPGSKLHVVGNQILAGNLSFTNSLQSIQFANPGAVSNPMMYMFTAGVSNPARMVIGHSPAYAGWGLQYSDNIDRFDFLSPSNTTLSIGLGTGLVGVGTNAPQRRLHVINAPSGTAVPNGNSPFVVENNTHNFISVLAPAASERGILFGDPGDAQDGGIIYNGANNELQFRTNGNYTRMVLKQDGKVGIGTLTPGYLLDVCGTIRAKEVRVQTGWCDYVFADNYKLPALSDVEAFIKKNKHLPEVTPGHEIETNGLQIGEVSAQMIKKIEELTLYVIELQKQVDKLKNNQH